MEISEVVKLAGEAGFGANQRNTLLTKLRLFAEKVALNESEACAKRLNDRAEQFRTKAFPHMYEEKAQILDYAAELVRSNAELSGPRPLAAEGSRSNDGLCLDGKGDRT